MAYIGYKKAAATAVVSKTLATMTGDGSDTTLTLSVTPGSVNNVCVCLDGVVQCPGLHFTLSGNVITFPTAPANGVEVIALSGGGEHIGSPMAGSIKSADLSAGAVTSSKIVSMDAAKLTGTYPALDASAVTGLTSANLTGTFGALNASAVTGLTSANLTGTLPAISGAALTGVPSAFTESASDPTISTNPSGGVGTIWVNTTSGEMFACTDATAGANVWTNVGAGDGDITPYLPGSFGGQGGGQNFGYHCGGLYPQVTNIQGKYSYASDGDATGVAAMMMQGYAGSGCQSPTAGYSFGFDGAPATGQGQKVEKHVFASNTQSHIGGGADLSSWHLQLCTATNSITHGYTIGGGWSSAPGSGHANYGGVQKLAFATEAAMTFVGDAYNDNGTQDPSMTAGAGSASLTHGYRAAGHGALQTDSIEKWAFASDANSAFVASMIRGNDTGCSGGSSEYSGYVMGGHAPSIIAPIVGRGGYSKYSFSSDADSTTVGSLFHPDSYSSGTSSTTHCYMAGGGHPQVNVIQKGSFATDGNTTDVGNIVQARAYVHGYQN